MKITRRSAVLGPAAIAALMPWRARRARAAGTLIDTLTLVSTSGTVSANTPSPPMFGLQFKKGDMPAGQYPQLQATDGTPWPATFINIALWSDGSMKNCGVLPGPFPKSIPTTGVTANILNGGSAPAASGLTTTQLYAELIQTNLVGLGSAFGLNGTWIAKLLNDANNVEVITYGDGGGGKVYRILTHVQQSGTAHGQLECYWYVQQLLDASNNLAGYRVLPRVTQPWYNIDSPAKSFRGLSSFTLQYGAGPTTVTPPYNYTPQDFTWGGANAMSGPSALAWYDGGGQYFGGSCITYGYLTTTNTLPTGWNLNTIYGLTVSVNGGTPAIQMPVNASGAGTGTHTFNPCQFVPHFGSIWGANSLGRYTYIQGAGSQATDPPILVQFNKTYRRATAVMPPIDTSLSPVPTGCKASVNTILGTYTFTWDTESVGPLYSHISQAGERDDIGLLNSWQARHFHNQLAPDDLYIRCMGLAAANFCNNVREHTTRMPVNLDDPANSYTGLPASVTTGFIWDTQYNYANGFTGPSNVVSGGFNGGSKFFDTNEPHHQPECAGYAYLVTGEPQYLDLITEMACTMPAAGWTPNSSLRALPLRTVTVGANTYYGCLTYQSDNGMRKMGWGLRSIVFASGVYPATDPYATQLGSLLAALRTTSLKFPNIWIAQSNSYLAGIGLFLMNSSGGHNSWMLNYYQYVNCLAYGMCEDNNALDFLNNIIKYYNHIGQTFTYWMVHDYYLMAYANGIFADSPPTATGGPISDDTHYFAFPLPEVGAIKGFHWLPGQDPGFQWDFGASINQAHWTPIDGDAIIFTKLDPNQPNTRLPGGFSLATPYYTRDNGVSGPNSFNLAAFLGGPAITPTQSQTVAITSLSWASTAGGRITVVMSGATVTAQGDYFSITGATNSGTGGNAAINATFLIDTWTNSQNFTLAAAAPAGFFGTLAGSPIGCDTSAKYEAWGMRIASNPSTGFLGGYAVADGYMSNFHGGMKWMVFLGVTNTATADTDTDTRFNQMLVDVSKTLGTFYQLNPKYAMSSAGGPAPPPITVFSPIIPGTH